MTAAPANWPFPISHHRERKTMALFELESPTPAKLTEVEVLSDKDREPGTNPGCGLNFTMTVGNDMLTMFDGGLRGALFTKNASSSPTPSAKQRQKTLDGVQPDPRVLPPSDLPNLTEIGKKLGRFGWDLELTGYDLTLDHGMGGKSNITLADCKLTNWSFKCKEGGSVEVKFRAESTDVTEKTHGKLALLKTLEFPILLTAPEVVQQDMEDSKK
jgi:hypothetical protein